ncbi:MAG: PepSY-like domain-containing protein [Flavobacteriales bacterium]|nr:PepSY-like domain-containing protein [Flavobacteriales bacterium]MCC6938394.1 PepSY-like domain-containing protein [Flavobacteriales bacterium]
MRYLVLLAAILLFTPFTSAQKPTAVVPPAAASAHLTKTYPGAVVEKWKKGGKHFKADFKLKGETYHAYYTPTGGWVRTEHNIPKSELPAAVAAQLKASKYSNWKIKDVEEHATPEQPRLFKLKVDTEIKKAELVFTPDGNLVSADEKAK